MADKYVLRVTAGPSYDPATHVVLPVNTEQSTRISSEHCTADIQVRVQNYRGLPRSSPSTCAYFAAPGPHQHDRYSISAAFTPHYAVPASRLLFGNDFDRPIRDRLPPGFGAAFKIVKWAIDPGLDGDIQADKPYLYGPALSSINVVRVGRKGGLGEEGPDGGGGGGHVGPEEGAEGEDAHAARAQSGCPDGAAERKKWALKEENREKWIWEAGRLYETDFFNPYLDFNEFALRLPGMSLNILGYMDGKDQLRYVLKDKETGHVFYVVVFTLVRKEDVAKQEAEDLLNAKPEPKANAKPEVKSGAGAKSGAAPSIEKGSEAAGKNNGGNNAGQVEDTFEPSADDVD